jgi:hypothetical protein
VQVLYRINIDWIDAIRFTYFVELLGGPDGFAVGWGEDIVLSVARGLHLHALYLHPHTVARYGQLGRIAVLVRPSTGEPLAVSSDGSRTGWWKQAEVREGLLYRLHETPFYLVNGGAAEAFLP